MKTAVEYFELNYDEKRFFDDRDKFMLARNPVAFSDTPSLVLEIKPTKFSHALFFQEEIAVSQARKQPLIEGFIRGSLRAQFPQTLNMQMVVATIDGKILLTRQ